MLCVIYVSALVAALLGADRLTARMIFAEPERYRPTFQSFYHPAVSRKMQEIDRVKRVDVLFIGNSLTMLGVDPDSFDRSAAKAGRPLNSYNLAFPSVGVEFWPAFLERAYPGPWPRVVALGVQPRDLNPAGAAITGPLLQQFFTSEGWRTLSMSPANRRAEELLSRSLILYGRRGDGLPAIARRLMGEELAREDIRVVGSKGFGVFGRGFHRSSADLARGRAEHEVTAKRLPFEFTMAAQRGLERLRALLRRHGTRLVLFTLPIFYDSEPEGNALTDREFVARTARFARVHSLTFLDAGHLFAARFGVQDFGDENHLDAGGARRFSRMLAQSLPTR